MGASRSGQAPWRMRRALLPLPLALAAGVAAYARWVEPRRLVARGLTLRLPRWPADLDGLRVALLGDVHAGMPHADPWRAVRRVALLRPDLVLFAGDLLEGPGSDPGPAAGALGSLHPPLGIFAVLGNHDRQAGAGGVADALARHGVTVLDGEARRTGGLWVAGVAGRRDEPRDAAPALREVPEGEPVLLLCHEPDVFPTVPERVVLTLAGHTHGGQVALPGLRALWTPSRHGERYARTHVVEGGRHLVVTSGVGTSRWPVRLGAPPEVLLLTLRSG